jgi:hypothetical protein
LGVAAVAVIGEEIHTLIVAFGEPGLAREFAYPGAVADISGLT